MLFACDLTEPVGVQSLVGWIKQNENPIFGWVLAAGVHALRPILMETPQSLGDMLNANISSPLAAADVLHAGLLTRSHYSVEIWCIPISTAPRQEAG